MSDTGWYMSDGEIRTVADGRDSDEVEITKEQAESMVTFLLDRLGGSRRIRSSAGIADGVSSKKKRGPRNDC